MLKKYRVNVNGQSYDVSVEELSGASAAAPMAAAPVAKAAVAAPAASASSAGTINAPMPGTILSVKVSIGQQVKAGDVLMILEAMKMENEITAAGNGVVTQIRVQAGATVNTGDPLVDLA